MESAETYKNEEKLPLNEIQIKNEEVNILKTDTNIEEEIDELESQRE